MASTIASLVANLTLQTAAFQQSARQAAAVLNTQTQTMARSMRNVEMATERLNQRMQAASTVVKGFAAGFAVEKLVGMAKSSINASIAIDGINYSLKAAAGSAEKGASEFDFVRRSADKLGLDLRASAQQFSQMAAAAKGTSMEGQKTRDIFTAIAEASTVLHLSGEKTALSLMAIQQMMSKGKVSTEELRRQLGDNLPGAFNLAANAMGVSTASLDKMLRTGKIMSDDFLPRFARVIHETYGKTAVEAASAANAEINRLKTTILLTQDGFARAGMLQGFVDAIRKVNAAVKSTEVAAMLREWSTTAGKSLRMIGDGATFAVRHLDEIGFAIKALVGLKAASLWLDMARGVSQWGSEVLKAANAMRTQLASHIAVASAVAQGNAMYAQGAVAVAARATAEREAARASLEAAAAERSRMAWLVASIEAEMAVQAKRRSMLGGGLYLTDAGRTAFMQREIALSRDLAAAKGLLAQADGVLAVAQTRTTAAIAAQTVALDAATFSARASAVAMRGLQSVMAFFGGPIGAGITAIGAAVLYLSLRTDEASKAMDDAWEAVEKLDQAMKNGMITSKAAAAQKIREAQASLASASAILVEAEARLAEAKISQQVLATAEGGVGAGFWASRSDKLKQDAEEKGAIVDDLRMKIAALQTMMEDLGKVSTETGPKLSTLAEEAKKLDYFDKAVRSTEKQTAVLKALGEVAERTTYQLAFAAKQAELTSAAESAGKKLDDKLRKQIDDLSRRYAEGAAANDNAKVFAKGDEAIREIERETQALGLSAAAADTMRFHEEQLNKIRQTGDPITAKVLAQLDAQTEQYYRAAVAADELRNRIEDQTAVADASRNALYDIGLAARHGFGSMKEAAGRALEQIADLIIQLFVLKPIVESLLGQSGQIGGGLIGGALNGLGGSFGGFFANGGELGRGQWGIVGENGPEPVVGTGSGIRVFPTESLRGPSLPKMEAANSNQNIYNIDARGSAPGVEEKIIQAIRNLDASIERRAVSAVARVRAQGGSRAKALR